MMDRVLVAVLALGLLAGCGDGNPLSGSDDDTDTGTDPGTDTGTTDPIDSDGRLPPGTESPTPSSRIVRYEPQDEDAGTGMIRSPAYDRENDTFFVDNLAFDGNAPYSRDNQVGSLGPFAVYENAATVLDPVTNETIGQFTHKAIYAVSQSGQTELAIVRTGAYVDYGFGGFVYQRNGGVTLPETGQAIYRGSYAGLKDYSGAGGLDYVTGDATVAIDFEDFNDGSGVSGVISNRRYYDLDGTDVTETYLTALEEQYETDLSAVPDLVFKVGPGVADSNGEMTGELQSIAAGEVFESGNFYAILSDGADGDKASEVVGVIVVESELPGVSGVTQRETGGFLVSR